ncbi:MAG: NUDIX domain-containing protein [Anaerolineae bacterium]
MAAVDGNVKRVISRLFAIQEDVSRGEGLRRVKTIAAELAGAAPNPADWTQALIEFGPTVSTPARPHCALCPAARGLCRAEQLGLAQSLPVKRRKKPIPHYTVTAAVIFKNSARTRFLITQRPPDGLLGGLWEFPGGKQEPGETLPACLRREIKEELAIDIAVAEPVAVVKHTFSHFKITLHAFAATLVAGRPQKIGVTDWAWVTPADLDRFAFGRADRKVIEALYRAGVKSGRAD